MVNAPPVLVVCVGCSVLCTYQAFFVRETVRQMLAAVDPESVQLGRKHRLMRRRYNSKVCSLISAL